ncbi:hypothetical protein B0H13DRAFT_2033416 [Mycena leptocephala]|nr:hypothetical protein B0H13DRAFT_2037442 [Mycena leptocephala]KAJ7896866.1 hypothetical protein B0H13DRAFT_2033416 [Mycena leptocephala]
MITIGVVKRAGDNGGREDPNSEASGKEERASTEDVRNSNPSVYHRVVPPPPKSPPKVDHVRSVRARTRFHHSSFPSSTSSRSSSDWKPVQVRFVGAPATNDIIYGEEHGGESIRNDEGGRGGGKQEAEIGQRGGSSGVWRAGEYEWERRLKVVRGRPAHAPHPNFYEQSTTPVLPPPCLSPRTSVTPSTRSIIVPPLPSKRK